MTYTVTFRSPVLKKMYLLLYICCNSFLQRGRIACNAERCNTYINSVCPSVRHTLVPYPDE